VAGHLVYVSSADHKVYALNAGTGTLLWSYETVNGIVPTTPTVANGMVYVGSWDKNVYALNANTGALVWVYTTSNSVFSTKTRIQQFVDIGGKPWLGLFNTDQRSIGPSVLGLEWRAGKPGVR
jgi:outer membrane protein assembly factor BamB